MLIFVIVYRKISNTKSDNFITISLFKINCFFLIVLVILGVEIFTDIYFHELKDNPFRRYRLFRGYQLFREYQLS